MENPVNDLIQKYTKKLKNMGVTEWDLMYPGHNDYHLCKEIIDDLKSLNKAESAKNNVTR
jgi:hypothetical protein